MYAYVFSVSLYVCLCISGWKKKYTLVLSNRLKVFFLCLFSILFSNLKKFMKNLYY